MIYHFLFLKDLVGMVIRINKYDPLKEMENENRRQSSGNKVESCLTLTDEKLTEVSSQEFVHSFFIFSLNHFC